MSDSIRRGMSDSIRRGMYAPRPNATQVAFSPATTLRSTVPVAILPVELTAQREKLRPEGLEVR